MNNRRSSPQRPAKRRNCPCSSSPVTSRLSYAIMDLICPQIETLIACHTCNAQSLPPYRLCLVGHVGCPSCAGYLPYCKCGSLYASRPHLFVDWLVSAMQLRCKYCTGRNVATTEDPNVTAVQREGSDGKDGVDDDVEDNKRNGDDERDGGDNDENGGEEGVEVDDEIEEDDDDDTGDEEDDDAEDGDGDNHDDAVNCDDSNVGGDNSQQQNIDGARDGGDDGRGIEERDLWYDLSKLIEHYRTSCPMNAFTCPLDGCGYKARVDTILEHYEAVHGPFEQVVPGENRKSYEVTFLISW